MNAFHEALEDHIAKMQECAEASEACQSEEVREHFLALYEKHAREAERLIWIRTSALGYRSVKE